jgi:hypothetical protein
LSQCNDRKSARSRGSTVNADGLSLHPAGSDWKPDLKNRRIFAPDSMRTLRGSCLADRTALI